MAWEQETVKLLRADLHAHQKLTREQLEATRDMREAVTTLDASINSLTQMFSMVLAELRIMRTTLQSIVSPSPVHPNGNGG